jgi:ABC-type transporter Mla subunit MlaD
MRRILAALVCTAAVVTVFVSGTAAGGEEGAYEVRAIFDNATFIVPGEEIRVAGAKVGVVEEIDVTGTDEAARANGDPEPGKAVVVMAITDPGFQDFRDDASCLIRPQSLIGEKFVECELTQPRAAASPAPPALEQIPEGEPGEGQYLLPLEQNGKAVDLDLVNNIMEEPYPDRFRLILNDLGAGFAARGDELAEIIERSNPALRETNEVLATLARQNSKLVQLSVDSDAILSALARERESVVGFINESTVTAEATAERREDLEESFARFPSFLRELRATMRELRGFSDAATPVFSDLGDAAPSLTRVNRLLVPFSNAGTGALTSLGDASEASAPDLVASDPVLRQIRGLAQSGEAPTRDLAQLLSTLRRTDGFEYLLETIFGLGGTVNTFDSYGHFLRALIPTNTCFDYTAILQPGCGANYTGPAAPVAFSAAEQKAAFKRLLREGGADSSAPDDRDRSASPPAGDAGTTGGTSAPSADSEASLPDVRSEVAPSTTQPPPTSEADEGGSDLDATAEPNMRSARDLLDFLIGNGRGGGGR